MLNAAMLKAVTTFTVLLAVTTLSAIAQEDTQAPRCWFLSKSFSPGSALRTGDAVWMCTAGSSWQAIEDQEESSGCFAEDKFFSTGGMYEVGKSAITLTCAADGSWQLVAPK